MSRAVPFVASVACWLTACNLASSGSPSALCQTSGECPNGLVCLAGSCAYPTDRLVVELSGETEAGQYARDVRLDGGLLPGQTFRIDQLLTVNVALWRETATAMLPYRLPVQLTALGHSTLIPQITRSYQRHLSTVPLAPYPMPLGAGEYTLTATADDLSIPPVRATVTLGADAPTQSVDFVFPSVDYLVLVTGRVLTSTDASVAPTIDRIVTQGLVDIQAFDPTSGFPLSQRFPVSSTDGTFIMTLSPEALSLKTVSFRATPRRSTALDPVPTVTFSQAIPQAAPLTLYMGDFGELTTVSGTVLEWDGNPAAQASVVIGGTVVGGGTFYSEVVTTDATGHFELRTLPGKGPLTLTALPPPERKQGGLTTLDVQVTPAGLDSLEVRCQPRVTYSGRVVRPDGKSPSTTVISATERTSGAVAKRALPLNPVVQPIDATGQFAVFLDRGATWEVSFVTPDLPVLTKRVQVDASSSTGIAERQVDLPEGYTFSGVVFDPAGRIAFGTLRFFETNPVDGGALPVYIGGTSTDGRGNYSVVLPLP